MERLSQTGIDNWTRKQHWNRISLKERDYSVLKLEKRVLASHFLSQLLVQRYNVCRCVLCYNLLCCFHFTRYLPIASLVGFTTRTLYNLQAVITVTTHKQRVESAAAAKDRSTSPDNVVRRRVYKAHSTCDGTRSETREGLGNSSL